MPNSPQWRREFLHRKMITWTNCFSWSFCSDVSPSFFSREFWRHLVFRMAYYMYYMNSRENENICSGFAMQVAAARTNVVAGNVGYCPGGIASTSSSRKMSSYFGMIVFGVKASCKTSNEIIVSKRNDWYMTAPGACWSTLKYCQLNERCTS